MKRFDDQPSGIVPVGELLRARRPGDQPYLELMRRDALSVGLYVLGPGERDMQTPHTEDEVYFVLEGRARVRIDGDEHDVTSGSVIFVEAGVEHRFEAIESDLKVLVVFAPAEGTAGAT